MKNYILICLLLIFFSCQTYPDPENGRQHRSEPEFDLSFKPAPDSRYYYDISNEWKIKVSLDGKNVTNLNKTSVGITYEIDTADLSNYVLSMRYDKVNVYMKKGDVESELDAANASVSSDPVEQMLGILISSPLESTVNSRGHVIHVAGYKDIVDRIIGRINTADSYSKNMAKSQLTKLIEDGLVKRNLNQLFGALPDSALRVGSEWVVDSKEYGEINLNIQANYKLEKVRDGYAFLKAKTALTSDSTVTKVMGADVIADLKGSQSGEFKLELETGMLVRGETDAKIKGALKLPGREVPIDISIRVQIKGKRLG